MTSTELKRRLEVLSGKPLPLPGAGETARRHEWLFEVALEDVSLAKLVEAHWDAVAILAEAGREARPGCLYAVWASEVPGRNLEVRDGHLYGTKQFCSGIGVVDRALITVGPDDGRLLDANVRSDAFQGDVSAWKTGAFRLTRTGEASFKGIPLEADAIVGDPGFYVGRPGFWHGACGPAACWAGGAAGLLRYAAGSRRKDAHTSAHFGAMEANVWGMRAILRSAGDEIDATRADTAAARVRALTVRHLIEQLATDILHRFARAYGPLPLAMDEGVSRRYSETDLFLRQSHAERDLESLGHLLRIKKP